VKPALLGAAAACATAAAAGMVLSDRAPYPYSMHRLLDIPLPLLTCRRLDSLLEPRAGQRVLEIGPGTGLQSLHVAPQLGAGGQLAVVDIQQEMLDHVMARAASRSIRNIAPHRADAGALPFADAVFDAAYLVTVLGEVPGPLAALMELRRVLKPGGRLIVGEFADRHHVPLATLARLANDAGLHLTRRTGLPLAYYALLRPCPQQPWTFALTAGRAPAQQADQGRWGDATSRDAAGGADAGQVGEGHPARRTQLRAKVGRVPVDRFPGRSRGGVRQPE
jgi:SAM-dependent methyltransferase